MQLILMAMGAVGLIVGSLIAATLFYWLLWRALAIVGHPQWASLVVVAVILLALFGELPRNQFTDMTVAFAGVAALPLWFAKPTARGARAGQLPGATGSDAELIALPPAPREGETRRRIYPAITACISEDRNPSRSEVHLVASRLWREGLSQRYQPNGGRATFAARRALLRAAVAALVGRSGPADPRERPVRSSPRA